MVIIDLWHCFEYIILQILNNKNKKVKKIKAKTVFYASNISYCLY